MTRLDYKRLIADLGGPSGLARLLLQSPFRDDVPPDATISMWAYRDSIPGPYLAIVLMAFLKVYARPLDLAQYIKTPPPGIKRREPRPLWHATKRGVDPASVYRGGTEIFS